MDFITVACIRDFDLIKLQAESMNKFVSPCTHWIFVNDIFPDKKKWMDALTPYYTKHKLNLVFHKWYHYLYVPDGFIRHAAYKLLMVKLINTDFVALDPKNFFIKPCSINDWAGTIGSGRVGWDPKWLSCSERYSKRFNMPLITDKMLISECPFVYRHDRLAQLGDIDKFIRWYLLGPACETMLYSYLVADLIDKETPNIYKNKTMWRNGPPVTQELLDSITNDANIKVAGFHRFYRYTTTTEGFKLINLWVDSLGLTNRIHEYHPSLWDRFINNRIYKQLDQVRKSFSNT
jgi:hypothetical protein